MESERTCVNDSGVIINVQIWFNICWITDFNVGFHMNKWTVSVNSVLNSMNLRQTDRRVDWPTVCNAPYVQALYALQTFSGWWLYSFIIRAVEQLIFLIALIARLIILIVR